jgi:hypothetical protein
VVIVVIKNVWPEGLVASCHAHGNELDGSTKCMKFCDKNLVFASQEGFCHMELVNILMLVAASSAS